MIAESTREKIEDTYFSVRDSRENIRLNINLTPVEMEEIYNLLVIDSTYLTTVTDLWNSYYIKESAEILGTNTSIVEKLIEDRKLDSIEISWPSGKSESKIYGSSLYKYIEQVKQQENVEAKQKSISTANPVAEDTRKAIEVAYFATKNDKKDVDLDVILTADEMENIYRLLKDDAEHVVVIKIFPRLYSLGEIVLILASSIDEVKKTIKKGELKTVVDKDGEVKISGEAFCEYYELITKRAREARWHLINDIIPESMFYT